MATIFTDEFAGSGLVSTAVLENFSPVSGGPGNEIAFVMGNLPDLQALIGGIKPGVEIHILDPLGDGIAQMDSILNGRSGIDSIHIFSHGVSGSLSLGTTTLNSNTLLDHQSQLAELGGHLTPSGDLLLYGCNVAQGDGGQAFIESIARTTGADVAASTDLTGAAALGGDWVLEANVGSIEGQNLTIDSFASVLYQNGGAVTIQQGTDTGLRSYSLYDYFQVEEFYFQSGPVLIVSSDTGATGADIVFKCITAGGSLTVGNWYTWTELKTTLPASFTSDQTYNNVLIDKLTANESGTAMDFTIAARIDWNNANLPATLQFSLGGSRNYTVGISKAAPPNTAPSAGSGSYTVYEGQSATVTLSTSTTSARDQESAMTFNPISVSYTAGINASLKGTVNGVSTSSYSVTDTGSLTGSGGVFSWNVTYADDPATWTTDPATSNWNKSWNTSGTNTTILNGAIDPESDAITYAIVSVNGAAKPAWMSINGSTGAITANVAPEFASQTYTMVVSATSSGTSNAPQRTFSITTGTADQLNDIPTASTGSQTVAEDAPAYLTFAAANFNFADLDNSAGLSSATGAALASIRIDSLSAHGTLKLDGVAVEIDGTHNIIAAADISKLTFTPTTDYSGSDSYTFSVNDGIAWSTSPATMNITVTPSNDAPVLVDGRPTLTTITENDTANAGNYVSDLISRTGGGTNPGDKSGMTDVDTLNNGGLGNTPESVGMGIALVLAANGNREAVDGVTADYGNGTGTWQYSIDNGINWVAVGEVDSTKALLLSATDKLRFVPNGENGTLGTLDYFLWDGANGTSHTTKVDVRGGLRGNATPYSLLAERATLVVSNVNDAPLLDLDGDNSSGATGNSAGGGASFTKEFLVRGAAVAIADTDISITDVDRKASQAFPDTIASATVAITAGATDNLFGTTYETLTAASADVTNEYDAFTITGSGTASISISGKGSWAEYQNIIKAITYQNANPNAFPGARTVTVTVVDSASTDTAAPATVSATSTITNVWAPSVDTNGVASGVTFTTAYTEGGAAIKIVTADATITDQDSHLAQVVVSISNVQNAGSETLTITGGNGANWNSINGLTVSGSGTSTLTLSGDLPPNDYQLALRSISYANSSDAPITTQRDITVVATDIQNHVGDIGHSYINLTAVNDAPVLGDSGLVPAYSTNNPIAGIPDIYSANINTTGADDTFSDGMAMIVTQAAFPVTITLNDARDSVSLKLNQRFYVFNSPAKVEFLDSNSEVLNTVTVAADRTIHDVSYTSTSANIAKIRVTNTGIANVAIDDIMLGSVVVTGTPTLTAVAEDVSNAANTGNTVAQLIADGRITDPDLSSSVPEAIAVSAVDNTNGIWQYKLSSGDWTAFDFTANSGKALLLDSANNIRFVPTADWNGTVANGITYHAWDKTSSAVAGNYLTVSGNTGTVKELSTATGVANITVNAVNDAPVMTGSGSNMTSITEDAVTNPGQAVSALLASVTDIDSATNGIAIYSTTVTGPTSGGKWQYNVNSGGWTDFGTVTEASALLLKSTDLVRFVPDAKNGQTVSFDYHAWDQYSGSAGSKVDVSVRSGATPFSTASDSVSITVTDVNDAPVLDLNSSTDGTGYITNFLVRSGVGVAIASPTAISITDVDVTAANVPESIAGAVVEITAGAVDNTFGTTYEKLTAAGAPDSEGIITVTGSLGTITVANSGTTRITISGAGTPTEYQNIIKAITYENANPNAYTGARTVTVTLTDSALTGGTAATTTATTTINNIWAPVVDTNGVATTLVTINGGEQEIGTGVKYVTSYTQGGSPVKIATADATITDEDSFLKSVVVSIHDATDTLIANAYEKLTITSGDMSNWNGLGLTVSGSGTNTITLTGNLPPSIYQLALRSISYANTASAPGEVTRTINVVATDVDDHVGYTGHTDINVIPVNSPPTLAAVAITGSIAEDALASTTVDADLSGTLVGSDIETAAGDLVYGVSGGSAGSGADTGKVIATGTYGSLKVTSSGGVFEYVKDAAAIEALADGGSGQDVFTVTVADGTGAGSLTNTSPPTNGPARTYTVNVTGANDAPVATGAYTHTVTDTASLDTFTALTGTLAATDVDTADTLSWSGSASGSYGVLTVNTDGTYSYVVNAAAVNALQTGSNTSDNFTVTVTDSQGATATRTIAMTVEAANDTPVATGTYTHIVTDTAARDAFAALEGTLNADDVDTAENLSWSGSATGTYGALTVGIWGRYSYVVNAVAVNALQNGSNTTDNFTVTLTDSQGATATRTIAMSVVAANDTPVATGTYTHTVTDTAVLDTFANLTGTLVATDRDIADTLSWSGSATGSYGELTVNANGSYSYVVNAAAVNALQTGSNTTDNFTVTVTDSQGATATRTIAMSVVAANDTPMATGTYTHSIADTAALDTFANLTGTLAATDVDTAATLSWSGSATGSYGALTVNTDGTYSYVVNAAAVNALQTGSNTSDNFTVTVTDSEGATATRTIAMMVEAANDTPVATGTYTHSIADTAALDTFANLTGTLAATDVDTADTLSWSGSATGSYGALTVNADGTYSYVVNVAAVNALQTGSNTTDNFTVTVTDSQGATATRTIAMTVEAANDTPVATGTNTHTITDTAALDAFANLTGTLAATDVDTADTLSWSGSATGSYGALTVNADGTYSYVVNAAAVNALQTGSNTTDNFTVTVTDSQGATDIRTVAINVTPANDTPVVSNNDAAKAGAVTEAGHLDNGQAVPNGMGVDGLTHVIGTLSATDVDNNATQTWSVSDQTPATVYGTMTINSSTGKWDFALNNYLPATQALREGDVVTETFTARVTDDFGAYADQTVTLTITGTNDVPVVANDASALDGVVTEAGNLDNGTVVSGSSTVSATLSASDVDTGATQTWSLVGKPATTYGVMSIDSATGIWTYTLDNTKAATQGLGEGDVDTQTYTARVTDDKDAYVNQTITITINGTNDSPVAVADTNTTFENAALTVNAANGILANDTDPDAGATLMVNAVNGVSGNVGTAVTGTNGGLFTIAADGSYSFNPGSTTFDYLAAGETTTTSVNYTVIDDKDATSSSTVTITLTGTNDAAVITGTSTASLTETDAVLTATGTLSATDVDSATTFAAQTNVAGTNGYGKFSMTTAGVWSYTADTAHNEFAAGINYTDSVTVATADGTQQVVTVTIAGTNDAAVITGTSTASLTETDAILTATGTLSATDVDSATTFVAQTNVAGTNGYGKFNIGTDGAWSYTANNAHNEFVSGTTYTDSITVATADGTPQVVTVTMTGSNDAALITGTSSASLTETDAVLTATGTLSVTDVDSAATFAAQTNVAGTNGYGKFSIGTNGVWNYTTDSAHNEFVKGIEYTDSVTVATADGTPQVVTVTIAGTNDVPVISGPFTADLPETTGTPAAHSTLTTTGTMEFSDVDIADTHTPGTVTASTGALGALTITKTADTTGTGTGGQLTWSYSVDAGAVEYLAAGETKDEIFTFTLSDDQGGMTERTVTVTLTGTNDAVALVSGSTIASGAFTEAARNTGSAVLDRVSSSIAFADADLKDLHAITVTGTSFVWSNGTLTQPQRDVLAAAIQLGTKVDSTGTGSGTQAWSFSAPDATFDFLAKDETLTATYTVTIDDGKGSTASKDVVITVTGTNDVAVISGTSTATLTETNTVLTATGTLSVTDVDGTAVFVAQTNVAGNHGYGKFSIGTDGVWHYTANTEHNEFAAGTNYTDSVTVAAADGTQQLVTVTIAGTNDAAVITGTSTASLTEGKTVLAATGTLLAIDVDSAATFVAQTNVAGSNGYGHFTVGTNGVWNYTTDSAHGEFITGTNYTDSFTVTTADGTTQLVSVTISGSNSGAAITGTSSASLTESDAVLTTTGTLVATDLDSPATFVAQTNVAGNHGYGHFTLGTDGIWSYTTDSAHNEFASGTNYTDSFTVSTADGTEQVVTVTIAGTNDAAVISGTSAVGLTQSGVPLTSTGTLSVTDVDSARTFVARTGVDGTNGYGKFSIGTDGVWSYTANSAHGEFSGGTDYTDSFTVATADGTQQLVTVTITGVDDHAVLSSVISTLPESSTLRSTSGTLTISDVDTPSPAFVAQAGTHGTNGTFVLGTDGVWSYTFYPELVFTAGITYSDVFTVLSADGIATTVSVYKTGEAISLGNDSTGTPLVDVSVPVGIGFSEAHSTESTLGTLRQQLIDASAPKVSDTAVFNDIRDTGIDAYVPTVVDQQQVTVRTITFSIDNLNTTASSDHPITISGALGSGESSTTNPNRQEALVVDATNLPSGTVLNFNNVEFAIVIGAVQVTGGTGKNFVIGDSASQWMVLGEGDDTLYGGGGDDTIGSHGGNDLLYGDAGNDIVSGGDGNDTLVGGSGNDTLYGGDYIGGIVDTGSGIDTAWYTDALGKVTVNLLTGTATSSAGGDAAGIGSDTLYDIENIVGGAYSDIIIGSNADNKLEGGAGDDTLTGGKGNDTVDGGTGKDTAVFSGTMADYSISYDAATHNWTIVDTIAGRDGRDTVTNVERFQFADAFQFQGGSGDETMTGGAGIDTVTYLTALAGITVDLGTGSATSTLGGDAAGIGNDTLISIENVTGGDYADTLIGSSADNQLTGGKGNDTLDGGSGTDTAVFSGNEADYTIRYDAAAHAYTIADKSADRDGTDTVINTEKFHFADGYGFTGGPGDETITGGTGHDTIVYLTALAGITVDLLHGTATTTAGGDAAGIGTDSLVSIENVIGGDYNDIITGNSSDNRLEGGKGNDTLVGGGGTDTAVFSGNLADYDVSYNEATDTYTITDKIAGRDGTDSVTNVHNFRFADGTHQDILKPTTGSLSPVSGETGVGVGNDVVLTFNELIHSGTGTIAIHSGSPTGPIVASSDDATSATVTISGSTLTINPTLDLAYNTLYYVTLDDGSIQDAEHNSYAGTTAYDFTTGADPYAGGSHEGNGSGTLIGLGVLGVLAWAIF